MEMMSESERFEHGGLGHDLILTIASAAMQGLFSLQEEESE